MIMQHSRGNVLAVLLFIAGLVGASTAAAAELHGQSSTQYLWFNDIFTGKERAELAEYLNVSVTKIDSEGRLTINGSGRGTYELRDAGDGTKDLKGRLYYLYADYRNLADRIDLRIGRQFVNYAAGSALVDGGMIELKNAGPVAFSVMGGRYVFFDLNGEGGTSDDKVFGMAAYLQGVKGTDAEISYFVKSDKDGTAREQMGYSFKQYVLDFMKVYTNGRYDLVSQVFSEVLFGAKYYPTADLVVTAETYQSYPTFDATSIYAVFAVSQYRENLLRADYTITEKIGLNAGYTWQDYDGDDANVFEIGGRFLPIDRLRINVNYDKRNGYGGKLNGYAVEAFFDQSKQLELSAGVHHDVYERDRSTGQETASKYWIGAKYQIEKNISALARIEDNVNARYNHDKQGRMVLNYSF